MARSKEYRSADDGWHSIQCVCRCLQSRACSHQGSEVQSDHARVIQIAPRLYTRVLVIHEAEHAEVINECAVGQHNVDIESEAFKNLHFGDNDGVFEVVERVTEIRHGCVLELFSILSRYGRRERVCVALEEEVVDVDEVSDPERTLL